MVRYKIGKMGLEYDKSIPAKKPKPIQEPKLKQAEPKPAKVEKEA